MLELPKESKVLKLISLGEIQDQIGDGWENESGIIEPTFPSGPEGCMKAERTPYFDECVQPSNKKAHVLMLPLKTSFSLILSTLLSAGI